MIKERYCSVEVSILLREKGFNELCFHLVREDGDIVEIPSRTWNSMSKKQKAKFYLCPTHQMAMDWLNETHNIFIIIEPYSETSCYFSLWQGDIYRGNPLKKDFPSFGETVEAALKYCLTELI